MHLERFDTIDYFVGKIKFYTTFFNVYTINLRIIISPIAVSIITYCTLFNLLFIPPYFYQLMHVIETLTNKNQLMKSKHTLQYN